MRLASISTITIACVVSAGSAAQREKLDQIEKSLKDDVPRILCVDERFSTSGQPTDTAFAKLAAAGFRSVLNLRTASEGVDLEHERQLAEKAGLRYISIPVVGSDPKPEQADQFLKAVKDNANQPMLIHCASANRVGGFWMIHRILDQGWPEDKALEEATKIGLRSDVLKKFAMDYIAAHKQKAG
ncbi:MAG TPA: protein tyrosine phosphatase family protein [Blastocatellia bacterium]|nr:protein tyrosine phosphatase family protein [Blastocatellia bacterium]